MNYIKTAFMALLSKCEFWNSERLLAINRYNHIGGAKIDDTGFGYLISITDGHFFFVETCDIEYPHYQKLCRAIRDRERKKEEQETKMEFENYIKKWI